MSNTALSFEELQAENARIKAENEKAQAELYALQQQQLKNLQQQVQAQQVQVQQPTPQVQTHQFQHIQTQQPTGQPTGQTGGDQPSNIDETQKLVQSLQQQVELLTKEEKRKRFEPVIQELANQGVDVSTPEKLKVVVDKYKDIYGVDLVEKPTVELVQATAKQMFQPQEGLVALQPPGGYSQPTQQVDIQQAQIDAYVAQSVQERIAAKKAALDADKRFNK